MALSKRWHAVSITPRAACCDTVKALRTGRFLSAEAPRLPVSGCSMPGACTCAYKHHDDRRARARRSDELHGIRRLNRTLENRRLLEDRRAPE